MMTIKTVNKLNGRIGMQVEITDSKDMEYLKRMCPTRQYNWIVLNKNDMDVKDEWKNY